MTRAAALALSTAVGAALAACGEPQLPRSVVLLDLGTTRLDTACGAVGDVDGDGVGDLLLWGRVRSGRDGSVLLVIERPLHGVSTRAASRRDVDGDGTPDLAFGFDAEHRGGQPVGAAWVASGGTGDVLLTVAGERPGERLGRAVELVGDLDGDGGADLLVTAEPRELRALSGADGALLWTVPGVDPRADGIVAAGDLDGDGVEDLWAPVFGEPAACARSGRDGRALYRVDAEPATDLIRLARLPDRTGDGIAELDYGRSGTSTVHDGATGALLETIEHGRGHYVPAGDADGDGTTDVFAYGLRKWRRWGDDGTSQVVGVRSPAKGELLGSAAFPVTLALARSAGDVDRDGVNDLLVPVLDRLYLVSGARLARHR